MLIFLNFKLNIIFVDNRIYDEVELSEPQAKGKKYALCLDHSVLFSRKFSNKIYSQIGKDFEKILILIDSFNPNFFLLKRLKMTTKMKSMTVSCIFLMWVL